MKNEFETSDFWLAATLLALGARITALDRSRGSRVSFLLTGDEINEWVEKYETGRLLIEPQQLFVQSKLLKNRLYNSD